MRKILITHGYGAGWSSWCENIEIARFIATYQPIIDLLEQNEDYFEEKYYGKDCINDPVLIKLNKDIKDKFNIQDSDLPYLGGAKNLHVLEVPDNCHVQISDFDGNEDYKIYYDLI